MLRRILLSEYFVLYLTIVCFGVAALFFPALLDPRNISNQLSNVWPLLAVAIGQTFVVVIAGIDLSLGATMGLASVAGGGGYDERRRQASAWRQSAMGQRVCENSAQLMCHIVFLWRLLVPFTPLSP